MKPHPELLVKISLLLMLMVLLLTCEKQEFIEKAAVTTGGVSDIGIWAAQASGTIINIGQGITQHGHCWATTQNPTVENNTTFLGSITTPSVYYSNITGLEPGDTYYIRAYAVADDEVFYGETVSFTTLDGKSTLTTTAITNITVTSAVSGGEIIDDGGAPITARGVCWNTSGNPTIGDSMTIDGLDTGIFTSTLTGLDLNTTYYIRAYATNSVDTTYGTELQFTTRDGIPTLITTAITDITINSATGGGDITDDGGDVITAKGVCWNTTGNPTIGDSKTIDGSGTGIFTSTLTGLALNTTYYVRAYATNSMGTSYWEEVIFKTWFGAVTDYDGNVYGTVQIGSQEWMAENLKVTHYSDGTAIPLVEGTSAWDALGYTDNAYCYFYNNTANRDVYGALYTWAAAMNGVASSNANPSGVQGVCPTGWHLPSDAEWKELEMNLGMSQAEADVTGWRGTDEGSKLKEAGTVHWVSPNAGATNESGFTALPGGSRGPGSGFYSIGGSASLWSSTEGYSYGAWGRYLRGINAGVSRNYYYNKKFGFSVRCLRD